MPLYEYQCDDCGVRFERRQAITADSLKTCPECGGEVRRLIHPVGVIFKGKGFYVTDNRKAKSSTSVPKNKSESTSTSEKGASETSAQTESSSTSTGSNSDGD
jgi:putative FmdB family regulatory protein